MKDNFLESPGTPLVHFEELFYMLKIRNYYNLGQFCPFFTLLLPGNQTHKKRLFFSLLFWKPWKSEVKSRSFIVLAQTQWLIKTRVGYNLIAVIFKLLYVH